MVKNLVKSRGVLRPHVKQGEFLHQRRAPSNALAERVEHYWYVAWDLRGVSPQKQETLPHPNIHYVIEPGAACLYGVQTGRFTRWLEGQQWVFGIKFSPGAFRALLRMPVSVLTDRTVPAVDILGAQASVLAHEVLACEGMDAMVAAAESFLLEHLPAMDQRAREASRLVADIAQMQHLTSVDQLVAQCGWNKRQLQRLFHEYVGVGPKWVIDRYRMHEALAQMQAGQAVVWADLALSLGYFDQAHFIREFHKLVGQSPGEYARAELNHHGS